MTGHHYLQIRLAGLRLDHLRTITAVAESAYTELMAAYGFDPSKRWRFDDRTMTISEERDTHGDPAREG
jgi:hypothetical protein